MKKDIHNIQQTWKHAYHRLQESKTADKKLLLDFIQDAQLGKHTERGKPVGQHKLCRYIDFLTKWQTWFDNTFTKMNDKQYNDLVVSLINNDHKKLNGQNFADETKANMIVVLNIFLRWLISKGYKITARPSAKQRMKEKDVVTIEKKDWERFALSGRGIQEQAILMFMLDSGARAEEVLNVRISDLTFEQDKCKVHIRTENSKTRGRIINIPHAIDLLIQWLRLHPNKDNKDSYLFTMTYSHLLHTVRQTAEKTLQRRIKPHDLRHSSATYYANVLTEQQLCYRYGWIIGSKVMRRYVNREQLEGEEMVQKQYTETNYSKLKEENDLLKTRLQHIEDQFKKFTNLVKPSLLKK